MNEKKVVARKLLAICIPIILSNIISQLQMLIDRIFLGRLDISAMSAASNASTPIWTTMSALFSLAVGANILISQSIGAGEKEKARAMMASLFKYANILALITMVIWAFFPRQIFSLMGVAPEIMDDAVSYARYFSPVLLLMGVASAIMTMLQVSEMTGMLVWYGIVRSAINIVLDYGLIFGNFGLPRMEVAGAAIATTIAELIGDIIVLVYVIYNKKLWIKPSMKKIFTAKFKPYIQSVLMGLPTAMEDFAWNIGNLFLIVMLNKISATAAGVYSIVFGMELLPICIVASISNGVLTLSGQETGKKNDEGIRDITKIAFTWCVGLAIFILVMFVSFPQLITSWFTTDQSVIEASATYLLIVAIDLFPKSANIIIGSGIKGHGDTKWMLGTQIFGTCFVIGGSAFLVLVLHQGIAALFCLVVCDEAIRSTINFWKLRQITKHQEMTA